MSYHFRKGQVIVDNQTNLSIAIVGLGQLTSDFRHALAELGVGVMLLVDAKGIARGELLDRAENWG